MTAHAMPYLLLGLLYAVISAVWLALLAVLARVIVIQSFNQQAKCYINIGSRLIFMDMGAKVALLGMIDFFKEKHEKVIYLFNRFIINPRIILCDGEHYMGQKARF